MTLYQPRNSAFGPAPGIKPGRRFGPRPSFGPRPRAARRPSRQLRGLALAFPAGLILLLAVAIAILAIG